MLVDSEESMVVTRGMAVVHVISVFKSMISFYNYEDNKVFPFHSPKNIYISGNSHRREKKKQIFWLFLFLFEIKGPNLSCHGIMLIKLEIHY